MRFAVTSLAALVHSLVAASPRAPSRVLATWDVEGYARDNPLGSTTGGQGGPTVTVETATDLKAAVSGDEPKIVLVKGDIAVPSRIKVGSNKSVIGVGDTAHITQSGIDVVDATNVILQNLKISFIVDNDCITIRNSTRVWVDHNEFTSDITQGPDAFVSLASCPQSILTPPGRPSRHHPRIRLDYRFLELLP